MKIICFVLLLSASSQSNASEDFVNVCHRSEALKVIIERALKKTCTFILEEDLLEITRLQNLGVPSQKIFRKDFQGLSNLKNLILYNTKIEEIEDFAFADLKKLEVFSFTHNVLKTINKNTFSGLSNLNRLLLEANKIESIQAFSFQDLTKLSSLSLHSNPIETLQDNSFFGLKNLLSLNLNATGLSSIRPLTFNGLEKLLQLRLSFNSIRLIFPETFSHLPKLRSLVLRHNNTLLHFQDLSFDVLPNLGILDLTGTELEATNKAAFQGDFEVIGLPENFGIDDSRLQSADWGP